MQSGKNGDNFWSRLFALSLPRAHLLAAAAVAATLIASLSLLPSEHVEAKRFSSAVTLFFQAPLEPAANSPDPGNLSPDTAEATIGTHRDNATAPAGTTASAKASVAEAPVTENLWREERVQSGDNLTTVFKRLSLDARDVYAVANAESESQPLRKLRPGETVAIQTDEGGQLARVRYIRSQLESYLYEREHAGFTGEKQLREPDIISSFMQARIDNSLFLDGVRAGLEQTTIMDLANIFGWDIDFALDIRRGDSFQVLYEELLLDGEKIGTGNILAAEFTNQGRTYRAVRFVDKNGDADYFAPDGKPMRKAFLRAPLDFTRVSSNFDLRRRHPIHKMIKAHRGVDYAAPRGTPVYAAGEGKVIASGYSRANGNYVFIQHGQTYTTKYLHLDKRLVRWGQTVKQRKVIGTVGSTGYATGPHLHYEFLVNGVHHNPRTVALPQAEPIPSTLRAQFLAQTTPLLNQLSNYSATQLASAAGSQ